MLAAAYPSQSFMYTSFNNRHQGTHTQSPVSYSSSASSQLDHSLHYTNNLPGMCAYITQKHRTFSHTSSQTTVTNNAMGLWELPVTSSTTCPNIRTNIKCSPRVHRKSAADIRITTSVQSEVLTSGHHLPSPPTLRYSFLLHRFLR